MVAGYLLRNDEPRTRQRLTQFTLPVTSSICCLPRVKCVSPHGPLIPSNIFAHLHPPVTSYPSLALPHLCFGIISQDRCVVVRVSLLPGPGPGGLMVGVLNVIPTQTGGAKPDTGRWRTETRRVVTSRWRLDDDLSPVHSVLLSCDRTLSAPHSAPPFHLQILNLFRFANFTG